MARHAAATDVGDEARGNGKWERKSHRIANLMAGRRVAGVGRGGTTDGMFHRCPCLATAFHLRIAWQQQAIGIHTLGTKQGTHGGEASLGGGRTISVVNSHPVLCQPPLRLSFRSGNTKGMKGISLSLADTTKSIAGERLFQVLCCE